MKTASLYGAYNARWLSATEVAQTFIPIPQFRQLVDTQSSILMGPRGCGKTTLLKMLTLEAQSALERRLAVEPELAPRLAKPSFVAIYVPSDMRWAYELETARTQLGNSVALAERVQRYMVTLTALVEACSTFSALLGSDETTERRIASALIQTWQQSRVIPSMSHLQTRLQLIASDIRGSINSRDTKTVEATLNRLPQFFGAQSVDALVLACSIYENEVAAGERPIRWALCFDELEIAPQWFQKELLASLRSIPRYVLKLTWTPVLPSLVVPRKGTAPEHRQDFEPIRLWQAHLGDANAFARELTTRIVRSRLGSDDVTPRSVFGVSPFAADAEDGDDAYAQNQATWRAFVELAQKDVSFGAFLRRKAINPMNPVAKSAKKRDQVLRKVKPIVLLRNEFTKPGGRRTRKRSLLYSGEEAIYAMSDGNPRWLAGVVNELLDKASGDGGSPKKKTVARSIQAEALVAASHRMKMHVKYLPHAEETSNVAAVSVYRLIEQLGEICRNQVLGEQFTDDPVGSFVVDARAGRRLVAAVERGLTLGALIAVTEGSADYPERLLGTRIRLSFMLSPSYSLLFRNYRWISLSTALGGRRAYPELLW